MFFRKLFKGNEDNGKENKSYREVTVKKDAVKSKENETLSGQEEYEIVEKEILPEKMICPDCGGITLVGLDFCDKCGGELGSYENY
ncbi:hypothetical protein [Anaerocolumna chitinilytica]|uniref:Zinc ribbon domain-containing protein n=1 Tax=Anaerocolumna chitinilytica TaxID=1727145 RepID=A0A7I8DJW1_9FIRM|nr:hypothetical protein [Anaerocolumna chitinilytica]BCJ97634.1 hypothetical protein bsdcttw_06750 [Anaerocolumna chitinilytica]